MAQAQALRLKTNRGNARAGNIGRVLKGMVPASRAAYGYRYCRDAEITADGRVHVTAAWWEIDVLSTDGLPERGSPAWAVIQIFTWIGDEGRTLYWAANQLNEVGIKAPEGGKWSPGAMHNIVRHRCYTGDHAYNASSRVPNPRKPLGDITAEVRRTLVRPKAPEELVRFKVPALVTKGLWAKANARITERGRGRGKQGQTIRALLRSRIFCPQCGRPMVVRRDGRQNRSYYHCSKYFRPWADRPCNYRKFIPATWDELVWGDICTWLRDDIWIERQLLSQQSQDENVAKLIRLQQFKKAQAESKIVKVQEGFEGGIYSLDQAKKRIAELQSTLAKADKEMQRLQRSVKTPPSDVSDIAALREELRSLRDRNLDEATFAEKLEVICGLGIKVYPSEDLKSMRVACQLNLDHVDPAQEVAGRQRICKPTWSVVQTLSVEKLWLAPRAGFEPTT